MVFVFLTTNKIELI